jgi:saccharopine dehydrogenase-like NADP-dependent oxidoreductase
MSKILLFGAGRSASSLIRYLGENAQKNNWEVTVADAQPELVLQKTREFPVLKSLVFDLADTEKTAEFVKETDIVISLLPPSLHIKVAKICLEHSKNLVTASYVSTEMQELHEQVKAKNLIFLNEIGLDPGIDHLSAMKIFDEIRQKNGKIISFKSFTGGLIAPESDDNPWNYKFTWNPQNVVLAGQATAKYLENEQFKYIPYSQLFRRLDTISVENYGEFDGYANRDSLSYQQIYGLTDTQTLLRGTLRKKGYCEAWNVFVQLGLTDNQTLISTQNLTNKSFLESFLPHYQHLSKQNIEDIFCEYLNLDKNADVFKKMVWLDIFKDIPLVFQNFLTEKATPAQILQHILEQKWQLAPTDKDMIVMQHQIIYEKNNQKYQITSDLVVLGEDSTHTAMAKTVGLPLGIATKLILENKINQKGVVLPITANIYEPILKELEEYKIQFKEKEHIL